MRKYELVVVLDARTSADERNAAIKQIEEAIGSEGLLQKDEIGAIDAAYELGAKKGNDKIYLLSYYCQLSSDKVGQIRKEITYVKGLLRYVFYVMNAEQKFFTYKELQSHFAKLAEEETAK